jgi:hypothetical protein
MRLSDAGSGFVRLCYVAAGAATAVSWAGVITPAHAVPAFAGQTGYPCQQCHVGALGPQLKPFGREFKLHGYTLRGGEGFPAHFPFALWVQSGFENYAKDQPQAALAGNGGGLPHEYGTNNNAGVDAISLFLAGGLNEHVGAFIQVTYDNTQKALGEDNTDIRVVDDVTLFNKDTEIGLTFNNAPGLSDPYNSNYVWGYPFIGPFLAPAPNASPILGGGITQGNSYGVVGYAWYDDHIYVDLGAYESDAPGMLKLLGEGYGPGSATGFEPYGSLKYQWDWGANDAHLGFTFFHARYNPTSPASSNGSDGSFGHNTYTDLQFDNGYSYITDDDKHVFTIDGWFDYETQDLKGSSNILAPSYLLSSSQPHNNLKEFRETATYYFEQTYGATVSFDTISGKKNQLEYNTGAPDGTGSISGSPNSTYWVVEADWVPFGKENSLWRPFLNWKLGLQYYIYTKFNGRGTNYDGFGRNASDNNTLFLYLWTVF